MHNHAPERGGHPIEYRNERNEWLTDIRSDPRQDPMTLVLKYRRTLPLEVATEIIPISEIRTAQEHASKVLPRSVSTLQELHSEIENYSIPQFTEGERGERLLLPSA